MSAIAPPPVGAESSVIADNASALSALRETCRHPRGQLSRASARGLLRALSPVFVVLVMAVGAAARVVSGMGSKRWLVARRTRFLRSKRARFAGLFGRG